MDSSQTLQNLFDQDGLLDILLGVEEYLDNMDLYAYKNWIEGILVEGPIVSKYWVEVTFKYTHDTFPDPRGALIFEKQGTKIFVKPDYEVKPLSHPRSEEDMQDISLQFGSTKIPKDVREPILLVKFQIPRVLVNPESFDEYKIQTSDFNHNSLMDDGTEQANQDTDQDIDFDEIEGDNNEQQ